MRAIGAEELRAALEGVLPSADLAALDVAGVMATAAEMLGAHRDVL